MKDFQAAGEAFSPPKRTCISSKHEISSLFLILLVNFVLLDPDPDPDSEFGSGSTNPIESGSNMDPDPDPQLCFYGHT